VAGIAVILVVDGARLEETLADEGSHGGGYSDAGESPTGDIWPQLRQRLASEGAMARPGYSLGVTITTPAHADLLTGRRERFPHLGAGQGSGLFRPLLPTLLEQARQQQGFGQEQVVLMGNTEQLGDLDWGLYPGLGPANGAKYEVIYDREDVNDFAQDDRQVLRVVADHLQGGARLLLANLHQVDRAGHYHPFIYSNAVQALDEPLAQLWDWLSDPTVGLGDEVLLVVLADHGRHRFRDSEATWQHHGCQCAGCRELPIMLLGAGIQPGFEAASPWLLEDVTRTVAWLMGVDLPHGRGLILEEALVGSPELEQPGGPVELQAAGDLVAWQQGTGEPWLRSQIVLDGEPFEDASALAVEAPAVARGKRDWACWRRLELVEGAQILGWQARCARRVGSEGWEELGFPHGLVSPHFAPALQELDEQTLAVAWVDPAYDEWGHGTAADAWLRIARWTEGAGWAALAPGRGLDRYPEDPSLICRGQHCLVASALGYSERETRYTRHVEVFSVRWPQLGGPSWTRVYDSGMEDTEGQPITRQEHPVLYAQGSRVRLAWQGFDEGSTSLLLAEGDWEGEGWSSPKVVDDSGAVLGHVRPAWGPQGELYWARGGVETQAALCQLAPGAELPSCRALDQPWVDSLAVRGDGTVLVSVSAGGGRWELVELEP